MLSLERGDDLIQTALSLTDEFFHTFRARVRSGLRLALQ